MKKAKGKKRGAKGAGTVFKRAGCATWTIQYYVNRKRVREATGETDIAAARQKLNLKLGQLAKGDYQLPDKSRTTVADLFVLVERDFRLKGRKSLKHEQQRWNKNVKPIFGDMLARNVRDEHIKAYIDQRLKDGAAHATVNRETSLLHRAFKLGKIMVTIEDLAENNVRLGFVEDKQFSRLTAVTTELWLRTFLELSYAYGWRKSEVLGMRVHQIDLGARTIRLDVGTTKNDEGREVTMTDTAYTLLTECIHGKVQSDYVLTRSDGKRVKDFRGAWRNLCVQVGLGEWKCRVCGNVVKGHECCGSDDLKYFGLIGHDFRRSAARGYRRAGVPQSVVMKIGGWKTDAMFKRYNIVDSKDIAEAIAKREEARVISPEISPDSATSRSASRLKIS